MNRLTQYFDEADEPNEPEVAESYWVIETACYWFIISREEALRIERLLERWWAPKWLTFTDSWGSRRRIPRSAVNHLYESTPGVRATARAFRRARMLEDKEDKRPWEDEC